jgi:hypothetical protein
MEDDKRMTGINVPSRRRQGDGLGPNSDIGSKLRALYGAVQEQAIPDKLLDLLDQLDEAEKRSDTIERD